MVQLASDTDLPVVHTDGERVSLRCVVRVQQCAGFNAVHEELALLRVRRDDSGLQFKPGICVLCHREGLAQQ